MFNLNPLHSSTSQHSERAKVTPHIVSPSLEPPSLKTINFCGKGLIPLDLDFRVMARDWNSIDEIPMVLGIIIDWEQSPHQYQSTFALDHTGPQFTPAFINNALRIMLRQFGMSPHALPPTRGS